MATLASTPARRTLRFSEEPPAEAHDEAGGEDETADFKRFAHRHLPREGDEWFRWFLDEQLPTQQPARPPSAQKEVPNASRSFGQWPP